MFFVPQFAHRHGLLEVCPKVQRADGQSQVRCSGAVFQKTKEALTDFVPGNHQELIVGTETSNEVDVFAREAALNTVLPVFGKLLHTRMSHELGPQLGKC